MIVRRFRGDLLHGFKVIFTGSSPGGEESIPRKYRFFADAPVALTGIIASSRPRAWIYEGECCYMELIRRSSTTLPF